MSLHYIIDGYNVINHISFPRPYKKTQDHRNALLEFIKREKPAGSPKNRITVVFDGFPDRSGQKMGDAGINVVFSGTETADAMIRKMVEGSIQPKDIAVVSNDKEITFFIKSLGARPVAVEEFIMPEERPKNKREDSAKPELNYSQISKINKELKELWLK